MSNRSLFLYINQLMRECEIDLRSRGEFDLADLTREWADTDNGSLANRMAEARAFREESNVKVRII